MTDLPPDMLEAVGELEKNVLESDKNTLKLKMGLANKYKALDIIDKAIKTYGEVINLAKELGDSVMRMRAYRKMGQLYVRKVRDQNNALICFERAEIIAGELTPQECPQITDERAKIKIGIGYVRWKQGDPEGALKAFTYVADHILSIDDEEERADLYVHLAMLNGEQRNVEKALEYLEKAKTIAITLDNKNLIFKVNNDFGMANIEFEQYEEAIEYFDKIISLGKAGGFDEFQQAQMFGYINAGRAFAELMKLTDAMEYTKKGEEIADFIKDPDLKGGALRNYCLIFRYQHKWKEAEEAIDKAIAIYEERELVWKQALMHKEKARMLVDKGDIERAKEEYEIASSLFGQVGVKKELLTISDEVEALAG